MTRQGGSPKQWRGWRSPALAVLAAGLTLTALALGCAPREQPTTPTPTRGQAEPTATPTVALTSTPTRPAAQVKRGGTLRSWAPGPPAALDPGMGNYWVSCQLNHTYGKLLEFRAQTYNDPEVVPSLVESWDIRDGGKTIQLNVRKGITWQNIAPVNGREFTAEDIAWNIDWYQENSSEKWLWTPVSSYEVQDTHTIVLKLDKPNARFFNDLASPWNQMLPREVWEQDGNFRTTIVGTGPFVFESFEPQVRLTRVARPDHWKMGQDGKPLPYVDGWTTLVLTDYATQLAALLSGQVDLWRCLGGPNLEDLEQIRRSLPGVEIVDVPRLNYTHIFFQNDKAPWTDKRVRRAAQLAIDPQAVIDAAWDGDAKWSGFIPPSLEDWAWPEAKIRERFSQNTALARQLLADAGYSQDTVIEMVPQPSGQGGLILFEVIQQMLVDVGFNAKIRQVGSRAEYNGVLDSGNYGLGISTDTPDADPDGFIGRLFASESANAQARGISIPGIDPIVERVRTTVDPVQRKAAVDEAQELLYEEMPRIPILTYNVHKVRPAHVKMPTALYWAYGLPGLDEVWLDR